MARKPKEIVGLTLRVREELRRRLEREAKRNNTSLNAEIEARLEHSFDAGKIDDLLAIFTGDKHSAKLLRMIAMATSLAVGWSHSRLDAEGLRIAINYLIAAIGPAELSDAESQLAVALATTALTKNEILGREIARISLGVAGDEYSRIRSLLEKSNVWDKGDK
jgi:hypothetical protein